MSLSTAIEWTDTTWNPVRGCSKISPGCKNCYAERFAERFRGVPGHPFEQGFDVRLIPEKISEPLRWKNPRKVFVNSMSDLFHESIPDSYILQIAQVMHEANWHIFQVLTKRHDRMARLLSGPLSAFAAESHIWWGVSVEDRKHGLPRLRKLQKTRIAVRFLSIEPLLEDLGEIDLTGIAWVIVGGESGPRARPMQPAWVRSIQNQCNRDGIPFFFKQWGGARKKLSGRILDGRTYSNYPKYTPSVSTSISGDTISPVPWTGFIPVRALAGV
jgi:protein gp37